MGNEKSPNFESENGFTYVYSQVDKCWYEVRKVGAPPVDVINQVKEIQEKAELLKESLG